MNKKIYYQAGDVVQVKHDINYRPEMIVLEVSFEREFSRGTTKTDKTKEKKTLRGINCYWYSVQGIYQTALFDTKDLEWVEGKNADVINGERVNKHI